MKIDNSVFFIYLGVVFIICGIFGITTAFIEHKKQKSKNKAK